MFPPECHYILPRLPFPLSSCTADGVKYRINTHQPLLLEIAVVTPPRGSVGDGDKTRLVSVVVFLMWSGWRERGVGQEVCPTVRATPTRDERAGYSWQSGVTVFSRPMFLMPGCGWPGGVTGGSGGGGAPGGLAIMPVVPQLGHVG